MKTCDVELEQDSVFLIGGDGVILDARESVCSALGWEHRDVLNRGVGDLLEYGADILLKGLEGAQAGADSMESFMVSTLVRTKNGCVPATAIVKAMPELNCFSVGFEDLPGVENEKTELMTDNANSGFRNLALLGESRGKAMPVEAAAPKMEKSQDEIETVLVTESQERRRLETRVFELTGQLQQLHGQLKTNLESEATCQKRLRECEDALQAADHAKVATEVALCAERKSRETLEGEVARLKAGWAKLEEERKVWQHEWLAKLEGSLVALQASDARLLEEISAREKIQQALRGLQTDFGAQPQRA